MGSVELVGLNRTNVTGTVRIHATVHCEGLVVQVSHELHLRDAPSSLAALIYHDAAEIYNGGSRHRLSQKTLTWSKISYVVKNLKFHTDWPSFNYFTLVK